MDKQATTYVGLSEGQDSTFWAVITETKVNYTDYPSIKDGQRLHWDDPEYWQYKTERARPATKLIVSGNAVSCEGYFRDLGVGATAGKADTVYIYEKDEV